MTTKPKTIPDGAKWCPTCRHVKGTMDFSTDTVRKDGLRSKCKGCDHRSRTAYNTRLALAKQPDLVARHIAKSAAWVQQVAEIQAKAKAKGKANDAAIKATRAFNMSAMIAASSARTALRT